MRFLPLLLFCALALANGETYTPNMSLICPTVGVTTGPQWGTDIVSTFNLIDTHDHSPGKGVQITPAGMNISSDLTCNQNNITNLRSTRMYPQASTFSTSADNGAVYESGVDLYFRDGNGNNVRLTQAGSPAGGAGSITGLSGAASASYSGGTFVWQSAANTSANLDAQSIILRNNTASSNGVTISAPGSLAGNYTLTLPAALPGSQKFATIDSAGNIASNWAVDASSLIVSSNSVKVGPGGIIQSMMGARPEATPAPTGTAAPLGNFAVSPSSGSFTTTSTSAVAVTGVNATIITSGRPVHVGLEYDQSGFAAALQDYSGLTQEAFFVEVIRGASTVVLLQDAFGGPVPPSSFGGTDYVGAGTYTYTLKVGAITTGTVTVGQTTLTVFEQ